MAEITGGIDRDRFKTVSEVAEWASKRGLRLSKPTLYLHLKSVEDGGTGKLTPYYVALQDTTYIDLQEVIEKLTPQAAP